RRRAFPFPVPAPADGPQRRLPDRRPLQPVRLLRGHAGRLLRPAPARLGRKAGPGRPALRRRQPAGLGPVPDRRGQAVRRDRLARVVPYALLVSSGRLLAAAGLGIPALTGGALYCLLGSTLAASAFFLLIELLDRSRLGDRDPAFVEVPRERQPFTEPAQTPLD